MATNAAQNPLISATEPLRYPKFDSRETEFRLTSILFETLKRTDMDDIWSDMSGVLYWVFAVGAAATRVNTPTNIEPSELLLDEQYEL